MWLGIAAMGASLRWRCFRRRERPAMTLIQKLTAAYDAEYELWDAAEDNRNSASVWDIIRSGEVVKTLNWENCDCEAGFDALRKDASMRAALRTLAEMRLSADVIYASHNVYDGDDWDEGVRLVTRAVLLAAAEEGESK